ncbi:MAG: 2,3,4,5-tetrahydropyridine-2,6-dicarboxylate N-succinyltransferase [Balneolales bacterium]|nr:2,3,4,5-tetrahydropyridine-2,6-dicarboxylate N-succinyltransferase [Balneolales bacterium]
MTTDQIKAYILNLAETMPANAPEDFYDVFEAFLSGLEDGSIRSAVKLNGDWQAQGWVKRGILLGFKYGEVVPMGTESSFKFFDKHTYPTQYMNGSERSIRIVPGGSTVRRGSFIANRVTMMPPMYVNAGAFVDEGTMIDSHALVGSCAQIGKRVHLSAAAQIGGVLEPIGAVPVIVEDDCMIGGNTGIYEGTIIRKKAVIGAGVVLTRSTPVYDIVNQRIIRAGKDKTLEIPENAVVIPGTRKISGNEWAASNGLSIQCPIIIKYRDDKTDDATELEDLLR